MDAGSREPGGTALDDFRNLGRAEQGLAVVSTLRADDSVQSSLVNAGVMAHPVDRTDVVVFVTYGKVKLANLRARPRLSLTVRSGWTWATVEGTAEIIGPDDPRPGFDADRVRVLIREIYTAAGGMHEDWEEFDRVMASERRAAVLVKPARTYGIT